ncbi:MAG TPA: hypothetical protein VG294_18930 [Solirubrobacteraceae bacterium]|jgi:hypothetical protein|nr:hypothetical protein [Solirubrobacteraceae bacterium]
MGFSETRESRALNHRAVLFLVEGNVVVDSPAWVSICSSHVNADGRILMAQTKADRSAAAKKAAATRERNRSRAQSEAAGKKAAGTRQSRAAGQAASQAKRAAGGAVSGAASAVRLAGNAAKQAGKAAATKASGALGNQKK